MTKFTPDQIQWLKDQISKTVILKGNVDEHHLYRQFAGYHNPEPHYVGEYSTEKLEDLLEERDESMYPRTNTSPSSRRTRTMGQGFNDFRKSTEPGEKKVVQVIWKGDKFPVEVEVMNEHLNILVAQHGVDLPKPVADRFAGYLDDLAGSLYYANVNHGPEAVTDILNGQIQGPAKWFDNTTAVVCAVIRDHIEVMHHREMERSPITGLLRVDDVSEAVLAAKKDARNGIAPSPKLVDADAVMHFVCGPCAEDRFPHIDTDKMYSNYDLCCYCDKLTKVGVIADDRKDRPRCTHVGDLAKLAISVQVASNKPLPAIDAYSPAGVLQKLHRWSGRNVHEIVDIDDKPMMELLGTALNGDQQLAGAVTRAAILAEDADQFSTLSSQAAFRFNNHRHVICLGCWEIGQPADYAPTRDRECNSYGRCCYCGMVTKCDITDMDLPDNPKFCRIENDTSPYQYHGVCKSCLPIVTGHHKHRAVPIFDPDYELDYCCICDKEQKTMVYAITPKKGFNPYTNTNKTTLCDDEHFTPITDKRRTQYRPIGKKFGR